MFDVPVEGYYPLVQYPDAKSSESRAVPHGIGGILLGVYLDRGY